MNDYNKYLVTLVIIINLIILVITLLTLYGILTGKISTEFIDTDNFWFWLFLLK